MKRFIFLICIALLVLAVPKTYAFDWQGLSIGILEKKEDGSRMLLTLKDKQNRVFRVIYQDDVMMEKMAGTIIKYKDEFYSWKGIRFKDLSFVVSTNFLEIMIIPTEINQQDLNLVKSIPAGITMTYYPERDILRYDFRIMKDNQLIRLVSEYSSENELIGRINSAYNNPFAYLRRTDPEYLRQEIERLQQALLYLYNEDWLNRFRAVPPETIQRIVELKQSNQKMTEKELWKMIKKEKIKITRQELKLILIIYFNEFSN